MKTVNKVIILVLGLSVCLAGAVLALNSEDEAKASALLAQIGKADSAGMRPLLEELSRIYFKENDYSGFLAALSSATKGDSQQFAMLRDYYTALARYRQLKYLEDKQKWDEYFSSNNTFRQDIPALLGKVVESAQTNDPVRLYSQLLLWRFYRDQQDPAADAGLSNLTAGVQEYATAGGDIEVIKGVAEELAGYNERGTAGRLYKLYVEKFMAANKDNDQELKSAALGFFNHGNLELSEAIYDAYIDKIAAAGKGSAAELLEIARQFSYRDSGPNDSAYAEKVFAKVESLAGKESLGQDGSYLRAFNLEKSKEFSQARNKYLDFLRLYPASASDDEAEYKAAVIAAYVNRDISTGRDGFTKLSHKETVSPQVISSFYQLGLLAQWEGKNEEARRYYVDLKARAAGGNFQETVSMADERLAELDNSQPIEYNLRTFLDASLRPENLQYDRTKFELTSHPYRGTKDNPTIISASSYYGDNGCLQPELHYLWSGDLGTHQLSGKEQQPAGNAWALAKPETNQSGFSTQYIHKGTKQINLVVVSSSGIVDRNLDLVDVYDTP